MQRPSQRCPRDRGAGPERDGSEATLSTMTRALTTRARTGRTHRCSSSCDGWCERIRPVCDLAHARVSLPPLRRDCSVTPIRAWPTTACRAPRTHCLIPATVGPCLDVRAEKRMQEMRGRKKEATACEVGPNIVRGRASLDLARVANSFSSPATSGSYNLTFETSSSCWTASYCLTYISFGPVGQACVTRLVPPRRGWQIWPPSSMI